jgi:hypothetical protein
MAEVPSTAAMEDPLKATAAATDQVPMARDTVNRMAEATVEATVSHQGDLVAWEQEVLPLLVWEVACSVVHSLLMRLMMVVAMTA